ncbi:hypothetical protein BJ165DRAFT_1536652 [Panaeolus papilionaceus]|nr:hypothetical protein BJ165DRAFT_1536652 [Panaeolus papilionaceus]
MADASEELRNNIYYQAGSALITSVEAIDQLAEKVERQQEREGCIIYENKEAVWLALCLELFKARADKHLAKLCHSMTDNDLDEMNIGFAGLLKWKKTFPSSTDMSNRDDADVNALWTEDMLFRHLQFLKDVDSGVSSSCSWVNAFIYHIASLLPKDSHVVFGVEKEIQQVPRQIAASIPCSAMTSMRSRKPRLQRLASNESVFYIAEAKAFEVCILKHIPQAIAEMYACARIAGKKTIRGAVTNGRFWRFLILTLNSVEEDEGGEYWHSDYLFIGPNGGRLSQNAISEVCSVLARWVAFSHSPLNGDDEHYVDLLSSTLPSRHRVI